MDLPRILDQHWHGNTVREWLVAAAAFFIALLVLLVARRVVVARLGAVAKRTTTEVDDVLIEVVSRTRWYFLAFVAFRLASRFVELPTRVDSLIEKAVIVVVLLQLGVWGAGLITAWVRRFRDRRIARADTASATTIQALGIAGRMVLWALIGAMGLHAFGFDITALVTGLGIGGVAIALAVQNILGDLFAALAIVLDQPFVIGDFIVVDTFQGSVEHIGLKTTRLRSISGEQIVIANGELLKGRIRNYKRMVERRAAFTIDITYDTPPDVVATIPGMLKEIATAQSPIRFDRSHFATFTDSALRFEVVYYVLDPDYLKYMNIQQAINLEILRRFNAQGIEFAFPTSVIHHRAEGVVVPAAAPAPKPATS